jgi:hypothetical protein
LADGPWQAWRLGRRGRAGAGRAFGLGPFQEDSCFFPNLFLMPETIPENAEIVLKARKILEKSQKFQENS